VRPATGPARAALICVLSMLLLHVEASGQSLVPVSGWILSESGPVQGAAIALRELGTDQPQATTADASGRFRLFLQRPGRYEISITAPGFDPLVRLFDYVSGQAPDLSFELVARVIELEPLGADAVRTPIMEVRRSSVSGVVSDDEIRRLPLVTRSVTDLAGLVPGIRAYRPLGGQALPAAGPLRGERFLNFYLDGMPLKNLYDGNLIGFPQFGTPFPADALREFRVFLQPQDPAYTGGATYVVSASTHRGTDQTHGSVFGLLQHRDLAAGNDFLRARPAFAGADLARVQSGVSLRGPVSAGRLHYAMSYELSRTQNYVTVVPRPPAADPGRWDAHAGVFEAPTQNHTGVLRLTYTPGRTRSVDAIVTVRRLQTETRFGGIVSREGAVRDVHSVGTLNLRHHWVPTPRFANETSLQVIGWDNTGSALRPQSAYEYPGIRIGARSPRFVLRERHVRVTNRATILIDELLGSHAFSAGLDVGRLRLDNYLPNLELGAFEFGSDTATLPAVAHIAIGRNDDQSSRDARTALAGWLVGAYVTNEWRPHRRIVLNAGVRYDAEHGLLNNDFRVPWATEPELLAIPEVARHLERSGRRSALRALSPRISASFSPTESGATSFRASFGIVHDRIPGFIALQEQRDSRWRTYTFRAPGTTDPNELRRRVAEGEGSPPSFALVAADVALPRTRQWSVGAGRRVTPTLTLNVDYVHQHASHVYAETNLNWVDGSGSSSQRVLTPSYGDIVVWDDFARARYRALLAQITWQPRGDARLNLAYTLGDARAEWDAANQSVPAAAADRYYVMQRISGDERHRIVLSGYTPLVLGVTASAIATFASPRPYAAFVGTDDNANGFVQDDWIDGRRYLLPADRWHNWYRVLDLRLSRRVPLTGRTGLSAVAEVFNVFNWENYSSFDGRQSAPTGAANANFRKPTGVFAPRQAQLGLRLDF
jgi:hypothetical protein